MKLEFVLTCPKKKTKKKSGIGTPHPLQGKVAMGLLVLCSF